MNELVFADVIVVVIGAIIAFFISLGPKGSTRSAAVASILVSVALLIINQIVWARTKHSILEQATCYVYPRAAACSDLMQLPTAKASPTRNESSALFSNVQDEDPSKDDAAAQVDYVSPPLGSSQKSKTPGISRRTIVTPAKKTAAVKKISGRLWRFFDGVAEVDTDPLNGFNAVIHDGTDGNGKIFGQIVLRRSNGGCRTRVSLLNNPKPVFQILQLMMSSYPNPGKISQEFYSTNNAVHASHITRGFIPAEGTYVEIELSAVIYKGSSYEVINVCDGPTASDASKNNIAVGTFINP